MTTRLLAYGPPRDRTYLTYCLIQRLGQPYKIENDTLYYGDAKKHVFISVITASRANVGAVDHSLCNPSVNVCAGDDLSNIEHIAKEFMGVMNGSVLDFDIPYCFAKFVQTKNRKKILHMLAKFLSNAANNTDKTNRIRRQAFEIAYAHGVPKKDLDDLWERINKNIEAAKALI